MKYAYENLDLNPMSNRTKPLDLLNQAGDQGWRVVHISPCNIALMERVTEEEKPKRAYTRRQTTEPQDATA